MDDVLLEIEEGLIKLNKRLDDLPKKLAKSFAKSLSKSLLESLDKAFSKISKNDSYDTPNSSFKEKFNMSIYEYHTSKSVKWINENMAKFTFTETVNFFQNLINKLIKEEVIPINCNLTRDEKRSRNALYHYLDRNWELIQPFLHNYQKIDM